MTIKATPVGIELVGQMLIRLDHPPVDAILRVLAGFVFLPATTAVVGGMTSGWRLLASFAAMLIGLRVVPAILRKLLPFPRAVIVAWTERRQVAKRYDSYQWQKLFWIGLGVLGYTIVFEGLHAHGLALGSACVISGTAGKVWWRTHAGRSDTVRWPAPPQRNCA